MILIQTAFAQETSAILRAGEPLGTEDGLPRIAIAGQRCAVLETGIGLHAARRAMEQVLSRIDQPEWVFSIGLAGALTPDFRLGDWAWIQQVGCLDNSTWLTARLEFLESNARRATLISLQKAAFTIAQKHAVAAQKPAAGLCDMETYAVASACQGRQIPWLGVRVVSDSSSEELKEWTAILPGLIAKRRWLKLVGQLVTHPQDLPSLVRLGVRMHSLQRQLTQLTRDLVAHVRSA